MSVIGEGEMVSTREPKPSGESVRVDNLSTGDVFLWCDRWVTLTRFAAKHSARRGRFLFVDTPDGPKRLHYYDDETVKVRGES